MANEFELPISIVPEVNQNKLKEEKQKIKKAFEPIVELNVGLSPQTKKVLETFRKQFSSQMENLGGTFNFKDIKITEDVDKQLSTIVAKYKDKMGNVVQSIYTPEKNKKGQVLTSKPLIESSKTLTSSEEQRLKIEQAQTKEKIKQSKLTVEQADILNKANNAAIKLRKSAMGLPTPEAKIGRKEAKEIKSLVSDITKPTEPGKVGFTEAEIVAKYTRLKILTADIAKNTTATKTQSKAISIEETKRVANQERLLQIINKINSTYSKMEQLKNATPSSDDESDVAEIQKIADNFRKQSSKEQEESLRKLQTLEQNSVRSLQEKSKQQKEIDANLKKQVSDEDKLLKLAERRRQANAQAASTLKKMSGTTAPSFSALQAKAGEINSLTSSMGTMSLKQQEAAVLRLNTLQKELNLLLGITSKEQRAIDTEIKKENKSRERAVQNAKEFLAVSDKYQKSAKLTESINKANQIVSLDASTKGMSSANITKTTAEIAKLNGELKQNQKGFVIAGHDALSFGEKLKAGITHLIAYRIGSQAVYAAMQELRNAVTYIKDLDKEMTNIQVVTGGTRDEMATLSQSYNDLGREMSASTVDIAKGSLEFIRQGKTAEETATLIRNSMMMSKLANMSSTESTEALTAIMNGYKLSAEETGMVVDKLVAIKFVATHSDMWIDYLFDIMKEICYTNQLVGDYNG